MADDEEFILPHKLIAPSIHPTTNIKTKNTAILKASHQNPLSAKAASVLSQAQYASQIPLRNHGLTTKTTEKTPATYNSNKMASTQNDLMSFLQSHSCDSIVKEDLDQLLRTPKVSEALHQIVTLALKSDKCILGVDEMNLYEKLGETAVGCPDAGLILRKETEKMNAQVESLKQQIDSMNQRIPLLERLSGISNGANVSQSQDITHKIEEVHGNLRQERNSIVSEIKSLMESLDATSQQWMFTHTKHLNEVYTSDDNLLSVLDTVGNALLTSTEDHNLAKEMDLLSAQLADVQLRLFTAQISYAYLTSLSQPPTPSRTQSTQPTNSLSDLKNFQNELETLVKNCQDATQLIARQLITDRVSDTLMRGRVDKMERELDGVQQIEDILEGMIGRISVTKDSLQDEISKVKALEEILGQLGNDPHLLPSSQFAKPEMDNIAKDVAIPDEIQYLKSVLGITNPKDVEKSLDRRTKLVKDLFNASVTQMYETKDDMRQTVEYLSEALYADSATSDMKAIDPRLLAQIREWERKIDQVKVEVSRVSKNDAPRIQVQKFLEKWNDRI